MSSQWIYANRMASVIAPWLENRLGFLAAEMLPVTRIAN